MSQFLQIFISLFKTRVQNLLQQALDESSSAFNVECKVKMFFRWVSSFFIKPQFFVGFSIALDRYIDEAPINCLKYAEVIDIILRGEDIYKFTKNALNQIISYRC